MVPGHRIVRLCKRLQVVGASSAATNARLTSGPHQLQQLFLPHRNPSFIYAPTRSFAVPAQFRPKPTEEESGPRLNEAITASHVRLVTDEGHRIISRKEALDLASRLDLDLVEVQRNADPSVCKIMDFHKENFKREAQEKERAKSKSAIALRGGECKEVRISGKTELKDLKIKADTVTRLMERGYRVKCTAEPLKKQSKAKPKDETKDKSKDKFKGKFKDEPEDEPEYKGKEDLEGLLKHFLVLLDDVAIVESGPHLVDRRQAYAILRHVKYKPKSGKKAIKVSEAVGRAQSTVVSKEELEPIKCSSQTESNIFDQRGEQVTDANRRSSQSGWEATTNSKPLHQKLSPDSMISNLELSSGRRSVNPSVGPISLQSEPSVVQSNRYAKQSEPKGVYQRRPMERISRNESVVRGQSVPNQRQFNPSTPPTSHSVGHEVVSASKPGPPTPKFGVFLSSKNGTSGELINKSAEPVVDKGRDTSSTTRNYGIFSSTKPVGSKDQKSPANSSVNNPSNTNSPQQSYGIFSSSKSAASRS